MLSRSNLLHGFIQQRIYPFFVDERVNYFLCLAITEKIVMTICVHVCRKAWLYFPEIDTEDWTPWIVMLMCV